MDNQQNVASGPQPPSPEQLEAERIKAASRAQAYYVVRKRQKQRLGVIPRG